MHKKQLGAGSMQPHRTSAAAGAAAARVYKKLPLYFIANQGQVNGKAVFYEAGPGHATFLTRKGIILRLEKQAAGAHPISHGGARPQALVRKAAEVGVRIGLLGINKEVQIVPENPQRGRVNYLIGNNPGKWRTDIPTYGAVLYKNAYPGIDIKFHGNNNRLEYDIIVGPGADPSLVRFTYSGAKDIRVTKNGDLDIALSGGSIIQQKPVVYQQVAGRRVMRRGAFTVREEREASVASNARLRTFTCGFHLGPYDRNAPLVVDPTLVYSSYPGGSGSSGGGIAVDASGDVYITGTTTSTDFPVTNGAYQSTLKSSSGNAFLMEFAPGGTSMIYSTYFGGSGSDSAGAIAVDAAGNAYITGKTTSTDFPVTGGAFQNSLKSSSGNAFAAEFAAGGASLVYSTYLGGSGHDTAYGIAVDTSGNAYVTGKTTSTDFPVTGGAFQNSLKSSSGNGFVAELAAGGSSLVYSTYLGGSGSDSAAAIAVDAAGNAYVTGKTTSTDFPVTGGAFQNSLQSSSGNAFVTEVAAGGGLLVYSTYLGGSGSDSAGAIAVDTSGDAYVTGRTTSTDFPVTGGAFQNSLKSSSGNGFVTEVAAGGGLLVYSTYLGGSGSDSASGIAVDGSGDALVTGTTTSTDFPITGNAYQTTLESSTGNAFLSEIAAGGASLVYSTYLGGGNNGAGISASAIAVDAHGRAYVTGKTTANALPAAAGANQTTLETSGGSAFLAAVTAYVPSACGTAANRSYLTTPPAADLCATGNTASAVSGTGPWTWTCQGSIPYAPKQCQAYLQPINGQCGPAEAKPYTTAPPAAALCTVGTASTVSGTGGQQWTWTCAAGNTAGIAANCAAWIEVVPACGTSSGKAFTTLPTTNLCAAGTASTVVGAGPWNWTCTGQHDGPPVLCSALLEVDGTCGGANGQPSPTAPTSDLCDEGTASVVVGAAIAWTWTCEGQNGGTSSLCAAPIQVDGTCGSANGRSFLTAPSSNLCTDGKASSVSTSAGTYNWTCDGSNGGKTANCSANVLVNGVCGSSNGQAFPTLPTANLCSSGTPSSVAGAGPWNWTCGGQNGGTTAVCSAKLLVNGACGSSNGATFTSTPTSNLCSSGTASSVRGSGPWNWSCVGQNGGATASCSAKSSASGGLWQNATPTGGGWYYLSPFGAFNTNASPWIYHQTLGWLYPVGTSTQSIWFYDPQWDGHGGWWWTSSSWFPWVYSTTENTWLYFDAKDSNPTARWFFNGAGNAATH